MILHEEQIKGLSFHTRLADNGQLNIGDIRRYDTSKRHLVAGAILVGRDTFCSIGFERDDRRHLDTVYFSSPVQSGVDYLALRHRYRDSGISLDESVPDIAIVSFPKTEASKFHEVIPIIAPESLRQSAGALISFANILAHELPKR